MLELPVIKVASRRLLGAMALSLVFALAPAAAQDSLTNTATVAGPSWVTDPDPANNTDSAVVDVTATVAYDFCPVGGEVLGIAAGGVVWRLDAGGTSTPLINISDGGFTGAPADALMIDPVRNRLLYVTSSRIRAYDGATVGWYTAASLDPSVDATGAAMTRDGIGYLVGSGASPQVWQVTLAANGVSYDVAALGTLTYDHAPPAGDPSDLAIDANGTGWLAVGGMLYTIDLAGGSLEARRQAAYSAPPGQAGMAFLADDRLFITGSGASEARIHNPVTGATQSATITAPNASADTASCAYPALAPAELSVAKTLQTVNGTSYVAGSPVVAGDELRYNIAISNSGDIARTLWAGDAVETLPQHTSAVSAGNDFTCSGTTCPNTTAGTIPAGGSLDLGFVVELVDPLPAGASEIDNAVTVASVDCAAAGNDCVEITPLASVVAVAKSSDVGDGTPVRAGDTITYTVTVSVANAATTTPVVITDTLGDGLTFDAMVSAGDFTCNNTTGSLSCTLPSGAASGDHVVEYSATVDLDATVSVSNSVVTDTGTCTACTTTNPLQSLIAVTKSAAPATGSTVAPGDTITYTLTVTVANAVTTQDLSLVDTLGAGLSFGAVTDAGGFNCSGNVTCVLPTGAAIGTHAVTYTATVDTDATGTVSNSVAASNPAGGDPDPTCTTCSTEHNVVPAAINVAKTANPASGTAVLPGATIEYTLTVTVTNSSTTQDLTLVDTLGAGLDFVAVTNAGEFNCSGALNCVLPAGAAVGSHTVTYTAMVDADATGTVGNSVAASNPPGGDADPTCSSCTTEHDIVPAGIMVTKTADPASGTTVLPGTTITYTLSVAITNSSITQDLTLVDTLGAGLTFGTVIDAGDFNCSDALNCVLPAGAAVGTYAVTYTATVDADATGTVGNSVTASNPAGGDPDPACATCTTEHDVTPAEIVVSKTANPASGSAVAPTDTIEYTLTVTVANSSTTQALTLVDTLGAGLTFGAVTDTGAFTCSGALDCVLPAGTTVGTYAVTYTATVDNDATGTVSNSVVASNPAGGDPDPTCTSCTTEHDVVPAATTVTKTASPASGTTVLPGETIAYTLTVVVENSSLTQDLTLVDTLGAGLTFGAVTDAGAFTCSGALDCVLPAGTAVGTYAVTYTATVDADATGTVDNSVTASNPPGGDADPDCTACTTEHDIEPVAITVVKSANPDTGTEVRAGDTIAYTLSITVANSATTQPLTLADTLGTGLSFGELTSAGAFACSGSLDCELPAGTLPGVYEIAYTATVDADATGQVGNVVTAAGGGGSTPDCSNCSTEHTLAASRVTLSKSSNPAAGTEVRVGDVIEYTLTALVENSVTTDDVFLVDLPGAGLDLGALPAGCTPNATGFRCAVPAGTVPGTSSFSYQAVVNADAGDTVINLLTGESTGTAPDCEVCEITHPVIDDTALRITKSVGSRNAKIGDLLRYTLSIENVGPRNFVGGTVLDTPPPGFSYVEGSMSVADRDGAFSLGAGLSPLRIEGLDIAVGERATVVYLLRVGAGVRPGVYINEAVALGIDGEPVSNVATAQVVVDSDPLLDDSLVFGTVFDDRDGDGWQDSAQLDGVRVQGGFAAGAYIAGSTTIDRGQGPVQQTDASAPLLHGLEIGRIAGRESIADRQAARQVVIRQRLREPLFTGDFVLTSDNGLTLRMDAEGKTTLERDGDAAKGMGAGEPTVERSIARVDDGYEVSYAIGNAGVDERGIPGVRVASVEGLLIETDQYGRFHLADVEGGANARGRNFILKVDPATLPAQTAFTTDNPLVRRITGGVPARFSFGVKLPAQEIPGATQVLEVRLGEVFFAPGSAVIQPEHMPAVVKMAEQVEAHGGGEAVITAEAGNEPLAFSRAEAMRDALIANLGEEAARELRVSLRTTVDDPHSLVAMVGGSETLLGTVLFDTDRSTIRPEFDSLLDAVAARLEQMGGGAIAIVGHTDVRASHAYNVALGLRRAQSVFDALARRLGPDARARLRVESSDDPNAPLGTEQQ